MSNEDQITYWNGEAGDKWVKLSGQIDNIFAPLLPEILSRAALQDGEHVLDIGCGGGALTLEAARRVGEQYGAVGVDVSKPLLTFAEKRAKDQGMPATFIRQDASQLKMKQLLDCVISRFGVMFFADPVGAFETLRTNLRSQGRMVFACWQALELNEWMNFGIKAALPFLTELPAEPDAEVAGPFAFANKDRLKNILSHAGWESINIEPWNHALSLPSNTPEGGADFLLKVGPLAGLLAEQECDLVAVRNTLIEKIEAVSDAEGVAKFQASIWLVTATAP